MAPLPNSSGFPLAFPRPGSKQVLQNKRVLVWDYTWTPGSATPMHFHDKDVVVVYLAEGVLASTTPAGDVVNNPQFFGITKFNPRDRTHTETLISGQDQARIVELRWVFPSTRLRTRPSMCNGVHDDEGVLCCPSCGIPIAQGKETGAENGRSVNGRGR